MRKLWYAFWEMVADQRDYVKFAAALEVCKRKGHEPFVTMLWHDELVACCPRCGKEPG